MTNNCSLFQNFQLLTMCGDLPSYGVLSGHSILVQDGVIRWIGQGEWPSQSLQATAQSLPGPESVVQNFDEPDVQIIEGGGRFLSPGLIDCHTHLIYGGDRAQEWQQRLNGVAYETIAQQGGGILSTVQATRNATQQQLLDSAIKRIQRLIPQGVTTVEIKSGYGLDLETELKMLRVAGQIQQQLPIGVTATLLAAHTVPPEYQGRSEDYVDYVCQEIIPAAKDLCDAVDVFCESIAFDLRQTERILAAAIANDLAIKVHAEQLTYTGSAAMAAAMGAVSVDHLECLTPEDCKVLAQSQTVATLLPGAFYNLRETRKPPVQALRSCGVPMAIASDYNPGSSPAGSILLMANMACTLLDLTPQEAICGLTKNAARAVGRSATLGTIEAGKLADFAIWDIQSPAELAYGIGINPCVQVYKAGQPVLEDRCRILPMMSTHNH